MNMNGDEGEDREEWGNLRPSLWKGIIKFSRSAEIILVVHNCLRETLSERQTRMGKRGTSTREDTLLPVHAASPPIVDAVRLLDDLDPVACFELQITRGLWGTQSKQGALSRAKGRKNKCEYCNQPEAQNRTSRRRTPSAAPRAASVSEAGEAAGRVSPPRRLPHRCSEHCTAGAGQRQHYERPIQAEAGVPSSRTTPPRATSPLAASSVLQHPGSTSSRSTTPCLISLESWLRNRMMRRSSGASSASSWRWRRCAW